MVGVVHELLVCSCDELLLVGVVNVFMESVEIFDDRSQL